MSESSVESSRCVLLAAFAKGAAAAMVVVVADVLAAPFEQRVSLCVMHSVSNR